MRQFNERGAEAKRAAQRTSDGTERQEPRTDEAGEDRRRAAEAASDQQHERAEREAGHRRRQEAVEDA